MGPYLDVLKKYATFSGRASRREFWMFVLIHAIILAVLAILGGAVRILSVLEYIYLAATLVPTLALQVRRLHDIDRSGGWWFITFVPFGGLVLLVWACMAGTPGDNRFGPNPAVAVAPALA